MFTSFAREFLCKVQLQSLFADLSIIISIMLLQAHRYRNVYPRSLLLLVGWYPQQWWEGTEAEQEDLMTRYGCSVADRKEVLNYVIAPRKAGRTFTDPLTQADSGIVSIYRGVCNFCVVFFFRMAWKLSVFMRFIGLARLCKFLGLPSTSSATMPHGLWGECSK